VDSQPGFSTAPGKRLPADTVSPGRSRLGKIPAGKIKIREIPGATMVKIRNCKKTQYYPNTHPPLYQYYPNTHPPPILQFADLSFIVDFNCKVGRQIDPQSTINYQPIPI
jgi:hypothetical protein